VEEHAKKNTPTKKEDETEWRSIKFEKFRSLYSSLKTIARTHEGRDGLKISKNRRDKN
jgi:L,D-peptidoglycan transpeptidase YkuD (ErfK/YbiS/YcfS/YnhG family)